MNQLATTNAISTLRGKINSERLAEVLAFPYHRRMRYLRMLRYLLPRPGNPLPARRPAGVMMACACLALALLAGCTDHTQDYATGPGAPAGPPAGPPSHAVTFNVVGSPAAGFQFSEFGLSANSTVTFSTYTVQVTVPTQIECVQFGAGAAVSEWDGVDWFSGNKATLLPSDHARTVTVVIAPSAGG